MKILLCPWLFLYLTVSDSSLHPDINKNPLVQYQFTMTPVKKKISAELKASYLKSISDKYRSKEDYIIKRLDNNIGDIREKKKNFRKTLWRKSRHSGNKVFKFPNFRRRIVEGGSSSSRGERDWKAEFQELWLHNKFEALKNVPALNGDEVNIVAARPWGIRCGDQNQHDSPWGTCSLPSECEDEYRIYRGDSHCGRTHFVCCAVGLTVYDMYQGFDISLAPDTDTSTDSEEKAKNALGSKEKNKRKRQSDRRKRKKDRQARSRRIRRQIRVIIKKIRKLLYAQNKKSTTERRQKTRTLKKFLKNLKSQYKKDRNRVREANSNEAIRMDGELRLKLNQMLEMNQKFNNNATYREMLISGKMTRQDAARMLLDVYPEIGDMILRRSGQRILDRPQARVSDHDDIEYGYLYY